MPELPEVETIRRDLEKEVVGQAGSRPWRSQGPPTQAVRRPTRKPAEIVGAPPGPADHLGRPERGEVPSSSLRTRGRRARRPPGDERAAPARQETPRSRRTSTPTSCITLVLVPVNSGFVDPRTFGELFVDGSRRARCGRSPSWPHLGFDPLGRRDELEPVRLPCSRPRKTKLKALLTDQKVVAGIGEHLRRRDPVREPGSATTKSSESLSSQEVRRLYRAMIETLHRHGEAPRGRR